MRAINSLVHTLATVHGLVILNDLGSSIQANHPPSVDAAIIATPTSRQDMQKSNAARMEWKGFRELTPETNDALLSISAAVKKSSLEPTLVELVKLRISQINGCAFCVQWHAGDARKLGESDDRLALLAAWRDAPLFSSRERAALAWAETLTRIADGASDALYDEVRTHFSDHELACLTGAIVAINAWNRIAVAYRFTPMVKTAARAA